MDARPNLNKHISLKDFSEFYWLKEELIKFCREEGLKTSGSKIEIAQRIEKFLQTGDRQQIKTNSKPKSKSKFDWKNEKLSPETEITDNYKNTENAREFFEQHIGTHFKFNVREHEENNLPELTQLFFLCVFSNLTRILPVFKENLRRHIGKRAIQTGRLFFSCSLKFMNWMKANTGKTLEVAIEEWENIRTQKKNNTQAKEIAPQFEYNRYLRDFLADNPNSSREVGIQLWKIKKSKRGNNIYKKEDLKLIDK